MAETIDINTSLRNLGLTDEQIASIPEDQKAIYASIGDTLTKQFESGKVTSFDLLEAVKVAEQDPDIVAKYGDSLKSGIESFKANMESYQNELTLGMSDAARKFYNDKRALTEAEAGAGRAYSGFRKQAEEKLAKDESSIISSSLSKYRDNLKNLSTNFETKYGTKQYNTSLGETPRLVYTDPLTGNPSVINTGAMGGIVGSEPVAKGQAIRSKASDLLQLNTQPK